MSISNPRITLFYFLLGCLVVTGCGGEGQKKIDFARTTVQRALETWQQGGTRAQLLEAQESIEFYDDDWERSAKLADFKIRKTYLESDGTARCAVTLTVKYGKRKPVVVNCTYQIVTEPNVIAARDPMA